MRNKLESGLAKMRSKFMAALPIILFFLFLFYTIILFFGVSYVLLVSVVTILFRVNYRKYFTARQLLTLVLTQLLMALLAFFATLNLPLCLILNLSVPFLLVYLLSSQFNQLGYYASAMCFTFLQLKHVGWEGLAMEMAALAYGMAVLAAALAVCSLKNRQHNDFIPARKGLLLLASVIRASVQPDSNTSASPEKELFPVLQGLYQEAYKNRGLTHVVNPKGRILYMFALLFQRAVYFLSNQYQENTLAREDCREYLLRFLQYMESAGKEELTHCSERRNETLVRQGKELLEETNGHWEAPYIFAGNFLGLFLLILENIRMTGKKDPSLWKQPDDSRILKKSFRHLKTDSFETRFALRLSMVLTVSFTYNTLSQANHGYWFALIGFFLLRPMYEDSAFRIKSRFIGTVAGCLVLQLLLPLFHGLTWHFALATIMAVGLYMETPGTWSQALFSTCFALTLTTMALAQPLAMELRLFYVIAAIFLVLVVNHFFFPTSMKSQFSYNLNQLFHIHQRYLRLLGQSLNAPLDYGVICDIQIYYHMVHDQIHEYLKQSGHEDRDFIKELLWTSWYMVSEAEQMLFLINNRKTTHLDRNQMAAYLRFSAGILSDIQKKLNMNMDNIPASGEHMAYKRSMDGEPQLSEQMEQYSKQVSRLYLCVCRHVGCL